VDWKEYEAQIAEHFKECYQSARITPNARIPGQFSKVERQLIY